MVLGAASLAAEPEAARADRQAAELYIKEAEAEWAQTDVTNDASVLRRIIADDFVAVDPDGKVLSKKDVVARAVEGKTPSDILSNKVLYANVRFYGDNLAVAQGRESWVLRAGGGGDYIWVDTWLKRKGKWQVIASQDTKLPTSP
jgi:ketosteroid isomerase-like protein